MKLMKHFALSILLLVGCASITNAQSTEFTVYENGLIYSPTTMKQLNRIVDSLNLRFKTCDLHKTYLSMAQGKGHYVYIKGDKASEARDEMEKGLSFDEVVKKYAPQTIEKDLLITRDVYKDRKNNDVVYFASLSPGKGGDHSISIEKNISRYSKELKNEWVYEWSEKGSYSEESISAFYLVTGLESKPVHLDYARMVQYTECMVDTNTTVFLEESKSEDLSSREENKEVKEFMKLVDITFPGEPVAPEYPEARDDEAMEKYRSELKKFNIDHRRWDSLRLDHIDKQIASKASFKQSLEKALSSALEKGGSNDSFEFYAARYASKEKALTLKRKRIVYGFCSMDQSPRIHALKIAMLSAEAVSWEVFLRAHLDIMNDRFNRMSDGSYAWAKRNTYIKELEELQINVPDLLLGISLRVGNPSQHHYFGSIQRVGRALSEAKDPAPVEKKMLDMISDNRLDDYNRLIMYYLFLNYNSYLPEEKQKINKEKEIAATKTLPAYLAEKVEQED